ncbi:stage V sporulation protein AD [Paenibacillus alkalitolerans]|uniref:stage V sporulation protein AD n=1 Tax=Paenibacillus alkalitolerans TaxID=2799335 RepID=UPI0018F4A699|nr:stage V sporulation protein AD [Paenibacillus alkalitolerans]
MRKGRTWVFPNRPVIASSAAVGGPFEAQGPLAADFDILHEDFWLGQDSFEKAEKKLLEQACEKAIAKAGMKKEDVQFFLAGDLMNQIVTSSFSARTVGSPYIGLFGACSTSMEGLALAALMVDAGQAEVVLAGTASHNSAVERQFRYPTEYGGQMPPTSQWTVTGAGAGLIFKEGNGPHITAATMGRVVDMGIQDPFNMGAAMAPAAVDTIEAHFRDMNVDANHFDLILTGDLGRVGHRICADLLKEHGWDVPQDRLGDCGLMIYREDQPVEAGASGAGCSATVFYGHIMKQMAAGNLNRILMVATGALLSPITFQQNETIPAIAHAVSIERKKHV